MGVDVIEVVDAREADVWRAWPVYWSAIWVGALAAIALVIVFGLVSAAVGAHEIGTGSQIAKWSDVSRLAVVLAVFGAFLSAPSEVGSRARLVAFDALSQPCCMARLPGCSPFRLP